MSRGPHHHGSEPVLACLAWLRCLAPAGIQELRVHVGESVSSEGRPVFIRILVVHTALALLASASSSCIIAEGARCHRGHGPSAKPNSAETSPDTQPKDKTLPVLPRDASLSCQWFHGLAAIVGLETLHRE